ncbi:anti-sigma-W factor RsiW [Virgibacillus sp. YIM 98842]|uniref:anti-sigma-W factor RsiW n=1 Tax=Virgibacillus sp. YIM 98842 TaxID=2663533 RepID=UPI0013DADD6E|nr:anti-sigma-W factor RsiW [Virgibacillus sp. YIM 98842]
MSCNNKEARELMHQYLDGGLPTEEENKLRLHLEDCEACQQHFHELKRTITLIQSAESVTAPEGFTANVMNNLPAEKKRMKYMRWFKAHPVITAAAIFFILMVGGMLSMWNQNTELVVSKEEDLVIDGDTVIVPPDVVVEGDLVVRNGDLIISGTVEGNVTIINGELIDDPLENETLMASVGEINGEIKQVDRAFEWMWYQIKNFFRSLFTF